MTVAPFSARTGTAFVLFAVLLGGCGASGPGAYSAHADMTPVGSTEPVSTYSARGSDMSLALAQMPEPGGAVEGMKEKIFANGVRQDIKLGGSAGAYGQNLMVVAVQSAPASAGARDQLQIWRPAESGIKNEIIVRYPRLDMQILTQPRRNALGPFGLAIGKDGNGVRCVFAWQWVEDVRNPGASAANKFGAAFGSAAQPASIRINMCRKDATVDDLAMAVEGLTLAPAAVIDRALAGRGPQGGGGDGGGAAVSDGSLESALTSARPSRHAEAAPPRRKRVARRAPKPAAAPEAAAETVAPQYAPPAAPAFSTGPRYLAPVSGVPGQGAYAAVAAAPATKALDGSLPAAAYRGPSGRN